MEEFLAVIAQFKELVKDPDIRDEKRKEIIAAIELTEQQIPKEGCPESELIEFEAVLSSIEQLIIQAQAN